MPKTCTTNGLPASHQLQFGKWRRRNETGAMGNVCVCVWKWTQHEQARRKKNQIDIGSGLHGFPFLCWTKRMKKKNKKQKWKQNPYHYIFEHALCIYCSRHLSRRTSAALYWYSILGIERKEEARKKKNHFNFTWELKVLFPQPRALTLVATHHHQCANTGQKRMHATVTKTCFLPIVPRIASLAAYTM